MRPFFSKYVVHQHNSTINKKSDVDGYLTVFSKLNSALW